MAEQPVDAGGAGNLIGTTSGDAYTYNSWGNLTSATVDGATTTASFDATGTRVLVDGVDQLWDGTGYGCGCLWVCP